MANVTLLRELRLFPVADTGVPYVGTLAAGTYEAIAVETRGSDQYVQVGTWICSASNGTTYATLDTVHPPITDGIDEEFLVEVLQEFRGYSYASSNPRYTGPIPNITIPIAPPKQNNCCVFVEDLVVHAFEAARWTFHWDITRHNQLMIADWNDIWTPPHGVADAGLALAVSGPSTLQALPAPWTVCQGWNGSSGHTFIVLAVHAQTQKVLILESTNGYGLNGPGLRGLGDLDNYLASGPPPGWWLQSSVPTWQDIRERYSTGIAMAQLKVLTSTLVWGKSS
jgi:hypothetical protein